MTHLRTVLVRQNRLAGRRFSGREVRMLGTLTVPLIAAAVFALGGLLGSMFVIIAVVAVIVMLAQIGTRDPRMLRQDMVYRAALHN